ncbi:MAG TPA: GTP cyclohydrolase, FolE2/MptA family, partial [Rhodocyclaceae bacterium]|nr:GTP cyclohydrolase, FolE2/MptA family [Rhodocyclaceae bacterium]
MNAPEKFSPLVDVQSSPDERQLHIDAVGIKGVRYPVQIKSDKNIQSTIATLSMTVGLAAATKGTHMSRFIELLEAQKEALGYAEFKALNAGMLRKLE